jgi:arylsulfatase B
MKIKLLILIFCHLIVTRLLAQIPSPPTISGALTCPTNSSISKTWDKRFGGSLLEELTTVLATPDGGYLLGGLSESGFEGDKSQASQGYTDYWVIKINATGNKVWDKRFGGTGTDVLTSMVVTSDGNYLIGGYSDSGTGGDRTDATRGSWDYWILKIDDSGNKLWDKRFGGTSQDMLYSIISTTDGGFLLGGSSGKATNTLTVFPDGDKSQAPQGYTDFWVIKISSSGVKEWDKRFGGTNVEELKSLSKTGDGGYLLAGYSESGISGDKSEASYGSNDYWVVKINSTGTKQWDYSFGGTDSDVLNEVITTTDGSFILSGLSHSGISGNKTQASQGAADFWVLKLNSNGIKQWDYRYGGTGADLAFSIQTTSDNGFIIGGKSESENNGDKTEATQGYTDFWMLKLDANGLKSYDKRFGGTAFESIQKMIFNADGTIILGGNSDSGITGDKSETTQGNGDYWIMKAASNCLTTAYSNEYVCPSTSILLTASNCLGSIIWSNGSTTSSIVVSPTLTSSYTATCTVNSVASLPSNVLLIKVIEPDLSISGTASTETVKATNTILSTQSLNSGVSTIYQAGNLVALNSGYEANLGSFFETQIQTSNCSSTTPAIKPNIIFILADDMGWDVFGNYPGMNGTKATTPTIDSLRQNGITFRNFWTNPECTPSRAAMLTGRYGFRTGVGGVQAPQTATLASTETLIQKYITDNTANAYSTAVVGKWHVSPTNQLSAPENFGINYYAGFLTGAVTNYYNWTETSGGTQQTVTNYTTSQFVDKSVNWIAQQTKPFFLWLAFNAPHTPFHRPPLNLIANQTLSDSPSAISANQYTYYLASIEAMDKEIARLISSLTVAQKENTVFAFIGDNGTPKQVAQSPYTMNTAKSTLFQGGINTPLLVCGKNITRKNVVETALVNAPDMFATFADIAGTGTSNYQDGKSIKPLFTNANASKRTFVFSELFGSSISTSDGYTLRNDTYKLIHLDSGTEYFYNLSTDPFETINLLSSTLTTDAQQNLNQLRAFKTGL